MPKRQLPRSYHAILDDDHRRPRAPVGSLGNYLIRTGDRKYGGPAPRPRRFDLVALPGPDPNKGSDWERLAAASEAVKLFVEQIAAEETVVTTEVGQLAIEASMRFGKVVAHPADLNFGDCFVYASAKARGEALVFVGDDFTKTDLKRAVVP